MNKSIIYALLCVIFWGMIPVVSKTMLREINNIQILFYSSGISMIVLFLVLLWEGKLHLFNQYSLKDYGIMTLLGFLGCYLYYVLLYGAFRITSAQEGFLLAYLWPVFVVLLGIVLLKEKPSIIKILSLSLSFFGASVIITHGHISSVRFTHLDGDALALSGAFVYALFSILGKKYTFDRTLSALVFWAVGFIFAGITNTALYSFPSVTTNIALVLVLNGAAINGITYIFWFKALESGDTAKIANLLYLSPLLSLVYIHLILHEQILTSSILGFVFITGGIMLQSLRRIEQ